MVNALNQINSTRVKGVLEGEKIVCVVYIICERKQWSRENFHTAIY